jgi:hypothetical protein
MNGSRGDNRALSINDESLAIEIDGGFGGGRRRIEIIVSVTNGRSQAQRDTGNTKGREFKGGKKSHDDWF